MKSLVRWNKLSVESKQPYALTIARMNEEKVMKEEECKLFDNWMKQVFESAP
jgi:hypothetical protein